MLDYLSDCTCYPQHRHCYTQHPLSLPYHKRHARDQTNGKWDVKLSGVPQGLHCLYAQDLFRSRRCHIFLWGGVEPFHTKKEKGKHPVEDACLRIELTKRIYSSTAACAAVRTLLFCGLIGILVSLTLWHGKFLCFYIFSCSSNFIFPLLLSSSLNIQISHFFAPLTDFLYPDEGFIVLKK